MDSLFESIKQGLTEAIEYERGNLPNTKVRKVTYTPVRSFSADEIKEIRTQLGMTQRIFAGAMGVSIKTIESWEAGTNHPSGTACRMLELLEQDETLFEKHSIVASST